MRKRYLLKHSRLHISSCAHLPIKLSEASGGKATIGYAACIPLTISCFPACGAAQKLLPYYASGMHPLHCIIFRQKRRSTSARSFKKPHFTTAGSTYLLRDVSNLSISATRAHRCCGELSVSTALAGAAVLAIKPQRTDNKHSLTCFGCRLRLSVIKAIAF